MAPRYPVTRHVFRILLASGLLARAHAADFAKPMRRSRMRILRPCLERPAVPPEVEVPLDARTWEGLAYLESVSGPGAIQELVEDFSRDVPSRLERMQMALARGDWDALGRLAHDLKSNAATLGILELAARAEQLERSAEDGAVADYAGLLQTCRLEIPSVLRQLHRRSASVRRHTTEGEPGSPGDPE